MLYIVFEEILLHIKLNLNFIFAPPTSFTAINNIFPIFFPFFSPRKWFFTNWTYFRWQVLFFQFDNILNTLYGILYPGNEAISPNMTVLGFHPKQNIKNKITKFFLLILYKNPFLTSLKSIFNSLLFNNLK